MCTTAFTPNISLANPSITLIIIRTLLGIILLSSVNVETNYLRISSPANIIAGLGPFNVTMALSESPVFVSRWFMMQISGLLSDPQNAILTTLDGNCSLADNCTAYLIPGDFKTIQARQSNISSIPNSAASFVVENAQGYLLKFSSSLHPPLPFNDSDCQIYGVHNESALKLCLKNDGNDLLAGLF